MAEKQFSQTLIEYNILNFIQILESNGNDSKPSSTDEVSSASLHLYELVCLTFTLEPFHGCLSAHAHILYEK